jgi:hypothetical protein
MCEGCGLDSHRESEGSPSLVSKTGKYLSAELQNLAMPSTVKNCSHVVSPDSTANVRVMHNGVQGESCELKEPSIEEMDVSTKSGAPESCFPNSSSICKLKMLPMCCTVDEACCLTPSFLFQSLLNFLLWYAQGANHYAKLFWGWCVIFPTILKALGIFW